ncbi:hypothetical protein CYY_008045 [Polysphondylium violaceum]|uniref:ZFYVE26-like TPR repeats domain-containing protein n=1 Tax=Polysphondylium violaceum TaxID=133409 RepID=A0A8J4UX94_9MYCE|nr:hypothetical protein CYY_008045 [Polysphondylium violaceum]
MTNANVSQDYYPFLNEEEDTKIIRLICNYLSLGQFELARALILQIQSKEKETDDDNNNNNNSNDLKKKISSILYHTIKNGPPSTWLTSTSVPSSPHLSWLCSIEFYHLNKDGFVSSISEKSLLLVEFAILIYTTLGEQQHSDRTILPIIQELREFHYVLLSQKSNHISSSSLSTTNDDGSNSNADYIEQQEHLSKSQASQIQSMLISNRLSTSTLNAVKKILLGQTELGRYILQHLSRPFLTMDPSSSSATLLQSKYPITSQIELITTEVISQLIDNNQYNEAYNLLSIIDLTTDNDNIDNNNTDQSTSIHSNSEIISRLLEKIANINNININSSNEQQPIDYNEETLTLFKIPFTSKLNDNSNNNNSSSNTISRIKVYESLLSNKTLNPLKEYLQFEDRSLLDDASSSDNDGTNNDSFPESFAILKNYFKCKRKDSLAKNDNDVVKENLKYFDQDDQVFINTQNVFWYWYYHFLRVNNYHYLEYALEKSIDLVKNKRFEEALIIIKPFEKLLPLLILLCWDLFENDIVSRKHLMSLLDLVKGASRVNNFNIMEFVKDDQVDQQEQQEEQQVQQQPPIFDPLLLHANHQLSYLIEMAEWCCRVIIAVPNDGDNGLIIGDSYFDIQGEKTKRNMSSSPLSPPSSNSHSPIKLTPLSLGKTMTTDISNAILNQLFQHSFIYVIKDCLPFITSSDILLFIESDPDFPNDYQIQSTNSSSNNNSNPLSSTALSKLNDMNLIRGYYLIKNILKFFQYRTVTSDADIDKQEFDSVLEDVFDLFKGLSNLNVSIGLIETIYLCLFLSNQDLKNNGNGNNIGLNQSQPIRQSFESQQQQLSTPGSQLSKSSILTNSMTTFKTFDIDYFKRIVNQKDKQQQQPVSTPIVDIVSGSATSGTITSPSTTNNSNSFIGKVDNEFNYQKQSKTDHKNYFVTSIMFPSLVEMLKNLLEYITDQQSKQQQQQQQQQQQTKQQSKQHQKVDQDYQSIQERIKILDHNLENISHRLDLSNWILKQNSSTYSHIPFMSLVLMPVDSLLLMAMRTDYPNFQSILEYFNNQSSSNNNSSNSSLDKHHQIDQYKSIPILIDHLSQLNNDDDESSLLKENFTQGLKESNIYPILCDIVLGGKCQSSLISKVLDISQKYSKDNQQQTFKSYMNWINTLHREYIDQTLYESILNPNAFPSPTQTMHTNNGNDDQDDNSKLELLVKYIKSKKIVIESLTRLIQVYENQKQVIQDNQQFTNDVKSIMESDGDISNIKILSTTFQYILSMNQIYNQKQEVQFSSLFSNLDKSPKELLEHVVFQEKNYEKAEKLAQFMNIDLPDLIISSLVYTIPKLPHPNLFKSSTPDSSALDSPIYFINDSGATGGGGHRSSNLINSMKLPNLNLSSNDNINNNNLLNIDLVNYFGKSSILLSCLMCMLKSPDQENIDPFIQYSKETSKQLQSSTLSNWINEILKAHSFYQKYFSGNNNSNGGSGTDIVDYEIPPHIAISPSSNSADSNDYKRLIQNSESIHQQQTFFFKVIQYFVSNGKLMDALKIADEYLEQGAPDWLLKLLVFKDKPQGYKYIRRMKDKEKAINLVMELYWYWDISISIDMVLICKSFLTDNADANTNLNNITSLKELDHLYQCFLIYQSILLVDKDLPDFKKRWATWQEIKDICKKDPARIVRSLLDSRHYELARKIRDLFSVKNINNEIEERYLYYLLVEKDDASLALQTLSELGQESIKILESLLPSIKEISIKLFLVQFLLSNMRNNLSEAKLDLLTQQEIGYQILLLLPTDLQKQYLPDVNHPNMILEMLIMNEKIPLVAKLLSEIKDFKDTDDLLVYYARKALSFGRYLAKNDILVMDDYLANDPEAPTSPNIKAVPKSPVAPKPSSLLKFGSSSPNTLKFDSPSTSSLAKDKKQELWVLTGTDPVKDEKTRHNHFFIRSPSISLAKSLFDLCESKKKVYTTSIELYSYLSQLLSSSYSDDNLLIINLIQQLLMYTKLQLLRDPKSGGPTLVAICDTYLGKVELFQSLVISKCSGSLSLMDLSDPQKARQLRDRLIQEDRLRLAIDVATKCNIPADSAWAAWGMSLIQMGSYTEAREKFKYCLAASGGDRRVMSPSNSLSIDNIDSSIILNQIIQQLESPPSPNHSDFRSLYNFMSTIPLNSKNPKIDDAQFYALLLPHSNINVTNSPTASSTNAIAGLFSSLSNSTNSNTDIKKINYEIDKTRRDEAIYYLKKYGGGRILVNFLIKHNQTELALKTVLSDNLHTSIFFDEIVVKCISNSSLQELFNIIKSIDPKLMAFQDHLLAACKILNERKSYQLLLTFQLFMEDYIRAGSTCVKMFVSDTDLASTTRLGYLEQAYNFFTNSLANYKKGPNNVLSEIEINKYISNINTQIEVSKFFYSQKCPTSVHKFHIFGSTKLKSELVEQLTIYNNFELGFKLTQEAKLPLPPIYINAFSAMVRRKNISKTEEYLNNLRTFIDPNDWDSIAMPVIEILCLEFKEFKLCEKLIPKLYNPSNGVRVGILCGKLKTSYLLAVQNNDRELVRIVMDEAQRTNQQVILKWCQELLEK